MALRWITYVMLSFTLFSCTKGKETSTVANKNESNFLLNLQHFSNESENYVSFPLWFNKQALKKHKISKITRQFFHVSTNSAEENENNQLDIREIKIYNFNEKGEITRMKVSFFYDDRSICEVIFHFSSAPDNVGFVAKVDKEFTGNKEIGFNEEELPFHLFRQIKSTKKSRSYSSLKDKQVYHFMLNRDYYGALSIDSILKPKPNDLIFLGSPLMPTKRYQVTNKVHETNVKTFTYKDKAFESSQRNEFPFVTKRCVVKEENGAVSSLIDSLFSDNNFISRTLNVFKLNEKNLPIEIRKVKENSNVENVPITIEKLEYEYFQ